MPSLRILASTSRTVSVLAAPNTACYHQPNPMDWCLSFVSGQRVAEGQAETTTFLIDGLEPETAYVLRTPLGEMLFETKPCAGLVEALAFGVKEASADNAEPLARAIAAVPRGGTLRLPAGRYVTSPIFLRPDMTLLLDEGATLAARSGREGWPQLPAHDETGRVIGTWEGLPARSFAALITAIDCDRLAITGRGVIDGGGDQADWWEWPKETRDGARRPRTVQLSYSDNASLTGITIRNSPSWTVHPYRSDGLHVSSLKIENPADSPNTDGLNPESCRDVGIYGVRFSVGDDCIAIKAGKRAPGMDEHLAPCESIHISHCLMEFGHGAVVIGSEMSGDIRRVRVEHCAFNATDRGIRLKTRRGRGGRIEDVSADHIEMMGVPTPFAANAFYFCDPDGKDDWVQSRDPAPVDETTPEIEGISLSNIRAEGVSAAAVALLGLPEAPIRGIELREFVVSYNPDALPEVPLMTLGMAPVRHAGIIAEYAEVDGEITVLDVAVELEEC